MIREELTKKLRIAAVVVVTAAAVPAHAATPQEPAPAPAVNAQAPVSQDDQEPVVPQMPVVRPAPPPLARVGVDESNPLPLSLSEAVEMALRANRDIEVERINSQQAGYDLEAAKGYYDPVLHSTDFYNHQITPVASALGGGTNGTVTTTTISSDATLQKAFRSGGFLEVGVQNVRSDTDNVFTSINPQYQTGLTLTFRQPLLRGLSMNDNKRRLQIARLRLDQSDAQFRQRVIETIASVQRGYWDLEFAMRNLQVSRDSVALAEEQIARLRRLVQEGVNAPVEIVQVEAELERRREAVYSALEAVTLAENNLKALVLPQRNAPEWDRPLVPTDTAAVVPVTIPVEQAITTAIQNRPEIASLQTQSEINAVDVRYFKNLTKPQVDLFGSYGLTGLAGTEATNGNPFSGSTAALTARVNELSKQLGLDPLPQTPVTGVSSTLVGGYGTSLGNLFSNDFRAVRVGVEIGWSVTNRTAEANLGRATAEGRKIDTQREALEQRVSREVRNALQSVQTARQRVDAARASREAAEVQLRSEQRRYEAGLSTTYFVLERQNELSAARGRELQALTDYNKAVADLQRVLGTTLTANAIDVKEVRETESR